MFLNNLNSFKLSSNLLLWKYLIFFFFFTVQSITQIDYLYQLLSYCPELFQSYQSFEEYWYPHYIHPLFEMYTSSTSHLLNILLTRCFSVVYSYKQYMTTALYKDLFQYLPLFFSSNDAVVCITIGLLLILSYNLKSWILSWLFPLKSHSLKSCLLLIFTIIFNAFFIWFKYLFFCIAHCRCFHHPLLSRLSMIRLFNPCRFILFMVQIRILLSFNMPISCSTSRIINRIKSIIKQSLSLYWPKF